MKTEGKYEYSKDYRTPLDKALTSLVEIVLLGLLEDRLEYGIEDLDTPRPNINRDASIILYSLIRAYVDYRGSILGFLDKLGYDIVLKAIPRVKEDTRSISVEALLYISIGYDIGVLLELPRYKEYVYYIEILVAAYERYEGRLDEVLDLVNYFYAIELYPRPIRG